MFPRCDGLAAAFLGEASLAWLDRDKTYGSAKAVASHRTPYCACLTVILADRLRLFVTLRFYQA